MLSNESKHRPALGLAWLGTPGMNLERQGDSKSLISTHNNDNFSKFQDFLLSNMEGPQDDFKGFGDGFEGFPKRLPDDCVEYLLFIIDAKLKTQRERLARLEAVRKEASKLTDNLLKEYIWQRENFSLRVENENGTSDSQRCLFASLY